MPEEIELVARALRRRFLEEINGIGPRGALHCGGNIPGRRDIYVV